MADLLTAEELAGRLGIRPRTVREWARTGRIPEVRLSPKVRRFELAEVIQALKRQGKKAEVPHAK